MKGKPGTEGTRTPTKYISGYNLVQSVKTLSCSDCVGTQYLPHFVFSSTPSLASLCRHDSSLVGPVTARPPGRRLGLPERRVVPAARRAPWIDGWKSNLERTQRSVKAIS